MGEGGPDYSVKRHEHIVVVEVYSELSESIGGRFYDEVRLAALGGPTRARVIVFDTSTLDLYDPQVVRQGRDFLREVDAHDIRIVVVTDHPIIRFAISTMQIFARHPIRPVATLEQAMTIARSF